jgi:hypothetical protein
MQHASERETLILQEETTLDIDTHKTKLKLNSVA